MIGIWNYGTGRRKSSVARVFIKKGTYQELIRLSNKPLVTLHGEDRKQTVIQYANNANFNPSFRPVLTAEVGDTTLENLTIRNLTPKGGSQAEASTIAAVP